MIISKDTCMELISEKFPEFQHIWNSYKSEYTLVSEDICDITPFWGDTSFFGGMAKFSDYTSDLLVEKESNSSQINEIFSHIEYLLVNGDEDVKNGVTTCFLENILNKTPEKIHPERFVQYLGPASREYCRAWDEFTGVQTEGV